MLDTRPCTSCIAAKILHNVVVPVPWVVPASTTQPAGREGDMSEDERGYYANFTNPFGLVTRMLVSRQRAAYAALIRAGLGAMTTLQDRRWQRQEESLIVNAPPSDRPLLFVTGGARTGTTVTTSLLAAFLEVDWLDNYAELFPLSPLTATRRRRAKRAGAGSLSNYYGKTVELYAPSDAFQVWNRWLGADRYEAIRPSDAQTIAQMRQFFDAWSKVSPLPMLNKNNRNLVVVPDLAEMLPNAHFVVLTRRGLPTVASLLKARRTVHGDHTEPWGVLSTSSRSRVDPLGYIDDICTQVAASLDAAESAAEKFPERVVCIAYEDMMRDPAEVARLISQRTSIGRRKAPSRAELQATDTTAYLSEVELDRAERVLGRLGVN